MSKKYPQTVQDVAVLLKLAETQVDALRELLSDLKPLLKALGRDSVDMLSVSNGNVGANRLAKYVKQLRNEIDDLKAEATRLGKKDAK